VALGKIFELGGISNGSPKTNQPTNKFRVARNVIPTTRGTLIPRYHQNTSGLINKKQISHITAYNTSPLVFATGGYYLGSNLIPLGPNFAEAGDSDGQSQTPKSIRINDTVYFLIPRNINASSLKASSLMKYDGVQMSAAGCSARLLKTNGYLTAGTRFLRAVRHTVDFDNNEPVSQYIQFPTNSASLVISTSQGTNPGGYSRIPDLTLPNTLPTSVPQDEQPLNEAFYGTAANDSANDQILITSGTPFPPNSVVGSYYVIYSTAAEMITAGYSQGELALALKVKAISPLALELSSAKVMKSTREWVSESALTFSAAIATNFSYATMSFMTVWESTSANGIYYFRKVAPYIGTVNPSGTSNPNFISITTTGTAVASTGHDTNILTIAPALNDWYDVNSIKLSPNSNFDWGGSVGFYDMTLYQNNLLLANEDYIWFSDTSLGGWIEQLNSSNSLLIGNKEFGRITAICGTADFLFVGRERKNYYVTGNIATGNYRVQEIQGTSVGPWCNKSALNIKDSVVIINSVGVYQISAGGSTSHLSKFAPANFNTYTALDNTSYDDVVFKMGTGVSSIGVSASNIGMDSVYNPFRELLVFMKRETDNACLVINTLNGEIYEWNGLVPTVISNLVGNCIGLSGFLFSVGSRDTAGGPSANASVVVETQNTSRTYLNTYPAKLYSAWLSAGEPSLEKELLQLKIFGRIAKNVNGGDLKVRHYKDWNIVTLITDTTYSPNTVGDLASQTQYSHKKRLNSDKCLAASVGIESNGSFSDFEIDSLEVEFNEIQMGMKR
jgi:hypothetical protein